MGVNDLQPMMSTKLSNFLSKNTHFRRTNSLIKHHENKYKEEEEKKVDHREKRKKNNKGWSFFLKNKLSSKIYTVFSKISSGNRSSNNNNNNNNGDPHSNGDGVKEKQRKSVGEILLNGVSQAGTRSSNDCSGGGEGKKMAVNRSRSLKRGVVKKKKKMKMGKEMVMERKQSVRRNGHHHHHHHHVEEELELCKKRILMGFKCKPINSSGAPLYDENGVISVD